MLSQPLKKFPSLESLVGKPKPVKKQSPDEIMRNIDRWGILMDAQIAAAKPRRAGRGGRRPPKPHQPPGR
jgi:hypothetical protein